MLETLVAFATKTSAGGFAWDHDIYAGVGKEYAQWRAWMAILSGLRSAFPDIVMDHRQTAHMCVQATCSRPMAAREYHMVARSSTRNHPTQAVSIFTSLT